MAWTEIAPNPAGLLMIEIGCSGVENHLAKQLPGCNHDDKAYGGQGIWRLPLSWASYCCMRMLWEGQELLVGPVLAGWEANAWEGVMGAWDLRRRLDESGGTPEQQEMLAKLDQASEPLPDGTPRALYPPQRGGAIYLARMRRAALTDDQGNGKTPQVIRALQLCGDDALPALVIAPSAALYNWRDELFAWAPGLSVRVIDGTALKRRKQIMDEDPADVYVIGWGSVRAHTRLASYPGVRFTRCKEHGGIDEATTATKCEVHPKELNEIAWKTVIADEAHRMQDARSKQTRAVWWLMQNAVYRWPMTGTPIADNIGQLWPVMHALDPASAPARARYLDLFAVQALNFHGGKTVLDIRPDTGPTFHAIYQPMMRRIPRKIALPWLPKRMPPVFRRPVMTPVQSRTYGQLKKELLAEIGMDVMIPDNTLVKFSRLCQLAASMVEIREGEDEQGFTVPRVRMTAPSSKVDDLLDFLSDNPGPLVVAVNSPQLVELAEAKLAEHKITHCKIVGGMSAGQKDQAVRWFQCGECRVCLITDAGGESVTLTAAGTIYFMQPDPSYRSREQKIGRIDRIGSEIHPGIRIVHSITPGTVEERLYALGCEKEERVHSVTRDAELLRWLVKG